MDMETQMKAQALMLQAGMNQGGETLSSQLSDDQRAKLEAFLKERGMDLAMLDKMKPWLATMLLTVQEMTSPRLRPAARTRHAFLEQGGDRHEGRRGYRDSRRAGKHPERHVASIQAKELMEFVDKAPQIKDIFAGFLAAWKAGNAAAMKAVIDENMSKRIPRSRRCP